MTELGFWESFWESEAVLLLALGFVLGVFDKLIDVLIQVWDWLIPFEVVDQYEAGVVLRWGVWHRDVAPGFRWYWPFGIERVVKDTVVRRTSYLLVQSLTSKDGVNFNSSPIVIYRVRNIKRWLLEVDDATDAINDITYAHNDELATETLFADVHTPAYAEKLTQRVKRSGTDWGAAIEYVKFSDRSKSRSMRLWTGDGFVRETPAKEE